MATMTRCRTLIEARRIAHEAVMDAWREEGRTAAANVLRRDGDTEVYQIVGRRVTVTRRAGHLTRGMWVETTDLPCVI